MSSPSAEHPNAVLVRKLYRHLAAGELAAYFDMLADNAVFHVGGDSIVAGEYRGKEAIGALGLKAFGETNGAFRTALVSVLANDAYAVTLHLWSAERRGRSIEMPNFNVYRFEDGLVAERWEFLADQALHDEFWAP